MANAVLVVGSGGGNDVINGMSGNDRIIGGNGADTLTGGEGNDTFVFNTALNAVDTITDFDADDSDRIELDSSIFTMLAVDPILSAANFAANEGGNATSADHHILYDTATGILYYDADGNGAGEKILCATLDLDGTNGTVDHTDFSVTV